MGSYICDFLPLVTIVFRMSPFLYHICSPEMSAPPSDLVLWATPAGVPPRGVVPNLVNPPTQAPVLTIGIYVLLPLMMPFFITRLYTRIRLTRNVGIDDCK